MERLLGSTPAPVVKAPAAQQKAAEEKEKDAEEGETAEAAPDASEASASTDAADASSASAPRARPSRERESRDPPSREREPRESEPVPSLPGSSAEIRGPYREIIAEGHEGAPSILEPALAAANASRGAKLSALPSGGPAGRAGASVRLPASGKEGSGTRAPLRIREVGSGSYVGAGASVRNDARKARRAQATAKRMWKIEGRKMWREGRVRAAREARAQAQ